MITKSNQSLDRLLDLRESIYKSVLEMQHILETDYPVEYQTAYQHWIPQILTALYNDTRWLSRGQFSCQHTIDHIKDNTGGTGGVSKYIT